MRTQRGCVLQPWTFELTMMQQAVLIAGVRGPDGIRKDHVAKLLLRWYRRCFILSAFTGREMMTPWEDDGGSFTGPSVGNPHHNTEPLPFAGEYTRGMLDVVKQYLKTCDEIPHHFQLHLMHGAEILGYKHPDREIRLFWNKVYSMIVNDMHLAPELESKMDFRLGDSEGNWRACEAGVTADPPKTRPREGKCVHEFSYISSTCIKCGAHD